MLGKELQFADNQISSAPTLVVTWEGAPSGSRSFDFALPDAGLMYIIGDNITVDDKSSDETRVYTLYLSSNSKMGLFYISLKSYYTDTYEIMMYGMETIPIANSKIFNSVGSPFTCRWGVSNSGTTVTNVRLRFYILTFQS